MKERYFNKAYSVLRTWKMRRWQNLVFDAGTTEQTSVWDPK